MKEIINICRKNDDGSLTIVDEKKLPVELNETEMALYTKYNRKPYKVEGSFNFQYIVTSTH